MSLPYSKDFLWLPLFTMSIYLDLAVGVDRNLQLYQNVDVIQERLLISQTFDVDKAVKCSAKCAVMDIYCHGYRLDAVYIQCPWLDAN